MRHDDNLKLVDNIVECIDDMMILSEKMFEEKTYSNTRLYSKYKDEYNDTKDKLRSSLVDIISNLSRLSTPSR